jgi:hypothetical protein
MRSKAIKSTTSHLISFGINVSFGVFLWGAGMSLTLGSFFNVWGFTIDSGRHIITIAWSLRMKHSFCKPVYNAKLLNS